MLMVKWCVMKNLWVSNGLWGQDNQAETISSQQFNNYTVTQLHN